MDKDRTSDMPDEMDYDEDVRWPTDKEDNENQCTICEQTFGKGISDFRARCVAHTQGYGRDSWMKVCAICQRDRYEQVL